LKFFFTIRSNGIDMWHLVQRQATNRTPKCNWNILESQHIKYDDDLILKVMSDRFNVYRICTATINSSQIQSKIKQQISNIYVWSDVSATAKEGISWVSELLVFIPLTCRVIINCNTTHLLISSMEYIPSWEAKRLMASQEIPRILRNPEKHCRLHTNQPFVHIPSLINTALALPGDCFEVHLTLFSHLSPRLPSGLFPSGFPTKTLHAPLLSSTRNGTQM
jgi:hypothetical protein